MSKWTISSSDSAIREAIRIFDCEICGPPTPEALRSILDRKKCRLSILRDGDRSMAQLWTWKEKRRMWQVSNIGFDAGLTPEEAMRGNMRRMRQQQEELGVTKVYAVGQYPSGSKRFDQFMELMEAQAWEIAIEKEDATGMKVYLYDRSMLDGAPGDEEWRPRQ